MTEIRVRQYTQSDIGMLSKMMNDAWVYYLQDTDLERIELMLNDQLENPSAKIWIAFENDKPVGFAEISIVESYRYDGEEARLELLFIIDNVSNYYDIHGKIMDTIFEFLRQESVSYFRIDTTLENADVMVV